MAKKATKQRGSTAATDTEESRLHILKLRLTPSEMQVIRVAAAVENKQPGVFAREFVLKHSVRIVDKFRGG